LELHDLIAKKFVMRKDVKAIQRADGTYNPDRSKWTRQDFRDHVAGNKTFGHYICDENSQVKLFVFDIDLRTGLDKNGNVSGECTWVEFPDLSDPMAFNYPGADEAFAKATIAHPSTPRRDWHDRKHPGRSWYKLQLRTMAETLTQAIKKELDIPTLTAYSGNKGLHVYGFTGEMSAEDARAGALIALEAAGEAILEAGEFVATKGNHFYQYSSDDPVYGYKNLEIEVFPKQTTMDGKDLGNLVRLPLGRNLKNPKDPCFFLDQRAPLNSIVPHPDPVGLLEHRISAYA
jgi:hypothetical protein